MGHCWSVWLMPHSDRQSQYNDLIKFFCNKYGSPIFQPHVTLLGRLNLDPKNNFDFFDKLVRDFGYFNLNPVKLKTGSPPWKSLFIELRGEDMLKDFQKNIHSQFQAMKNYYFDPHLSLAYGDIQVKKEDLELISLDETICFSYVALVSTPNQIDDWRIIKKFKLNGIN